MAISGDRTVLRPTWVSTWSIPVTVSIVVVVLSVIADVAPQFPIVYCAVFTCGFVLLDRRRSLELGPTSAVRRGAPREQSMDRVEVRSVAAGSWWRGGLVMRGEQRSMWAGIGDRPLGFVSAERLGIVEQWAAGGATEQPGARR